MSTSIIPQDRVHVVPRRSPVNLQALDDELGEVSRSVRRPERTPLDPVPEQVQDVGRLAADAVLATAETAAQEVAKLSALVKELAPQLEASLADLDKSLLIITEACKQVRDRGERTKLLVEASNNLAKDIRDKCAEFSKMVNGDGN